MTPNRLVSNGCSYAESYANGNGHADLAKLLNIENSLSLAIGGSSNSRILRSTLKDSYSTNEPTLYIVGLTFLNRTEIPILQLFNVNNEMDDNTVEGRWTNPQNQKFSKYWLPFWKQDDTDKFVELWFKANTFGSVDLVEDLMYRLLSFINDLESRGHKVLIFNQADVALTLERENNNKVLDVSKLKLLKSKDNIISGLSWLAIPWQHDQDVAFMDYPTDGKYPAPADNIKHRMPGQHQKLNEYLINYIQEYKILE